MTIFKRLALTLIVSASLLKLQAQPAGNPVPTEKKSAPTRDVWYDYNVGAIRLGSIMLSNSLDTSDKPLSPTIRAIQSGDSSIVYYYNGKRWKNISAETGTITQDTVVDNIGILANNIGAINKVRATAKGFYSENDGGGGNFFWDSSSNSPPIIGIVVKVIGHPNGAWVRLTDNINFNLKWFGAKGIGGSGLLQDTTAFRTAITYIGTKGGGRLYIPNTFTSDGKQSYYAFAGTAVYVGDNIEIYGDGKGKSEIRNISPTSSAARPGAIIGLTTYGANLNGGIFDPSVPEIQVFPASLGDTVLKVVNIADTALIPIKRPSMYGWGREFHSGDPNKPRFTYAENNIVVRKKNDSIFFKYPFRIDIKDTLGVHGVIHSLCNAGYSTTYRVPKGATQNVKVHDMTFTQAQIDELSDTAITKQLAGVWQEGGAVEGEFYNLFISAYSGLGGNLWAHCKFYNMDVYAEKQFMDFGYNSVDVTMHDIHYTFKESPASDFASAIITMNDGAHDIYLRNLTFDGEIFKGGTILSLSSAQRVSLDGIKVRLSQYFYDNVIVLISETPTRPTYDLSIRNSDFQVGAAGTFLYIAGSNDSITNRRIIIDNCTWKGTLVGYFGSNQYVITYHASATVSRGDTYSNNGSNFQARDKKSVELAPGVWQGNFTRVLGTTDPLASGTLTKVIGSGPTTIPYDNWLLDDVSAPNAVQLRGVSDVSLNNLSFDTGKILTQLKVSRCFLNNVRTKDSLVFTGTTTQSAFGVNVPFASTTNLGNALAIVGGIGYINNTKLGSTGALQADGTVPLTANWNAGAFNIQANSFTAFGQTGLGYLELRNQSTITTSSLVGGVKIFNALTYFAWNTSQDGFTRKYAGALTADRTYNMQDKSGTLAMVGDAKRVSSVTSASTVTPDANSFDAIKVTALAATCNFANPTGTPNPMQELVIRVTDNGTAQILSWGTAYRQGADLRLPLATVAGKTMYFKFYWNSDSSTWDFVSLIVI